MFLNPVAIIIFISPTRPMVDNKNKKQQPIIDKLNSNLTINNIIPIIQPVYYFETF